MITLSFLKLLQDSGFGTIDTDLFFQKLTLDKTGLYISDIGDPLVRGQRKTQSFELYSRAENDVDGYKQLSAILEFLEESYSGVCELPEVIIQGRTLTRGYSNVTILPTGNITNVGLDGNNRIIYAIQGQIIYKKEN